MSVRQSTEILTIDAVRGAIGEMIPKGQTTLAQTAEAMGFSARTLQRRLAEQGLNYSRLVDEVRFIKARELIQERQKLSDVATHLGYSDAGSFTRAFERWTGMSPLQYRKRFYQSVRMVKRYSHKK